MEHFSASLSPLGTSVAGAPRHFQQTHHRTGQRQRCDRWTTTQVTPSFTTHLSHQPGLYGHSCLLGMWPHLIWCRHPPRHLITITVRHIVTYYSDWAINLVRIWFYLAVYKQASDNHISLYPSSHYSRWAKMIWKRHKMGVTHTQRFTSPATSISLRSWGYSFYVTLHQTETVYMCSQRHAAVTGSKK